MLKEEEEEKSRVTGRFKAGGQMFCGATNLDWKKKNDRGESRHAEEVNSELNV